MQGEQGEQGGAKVDRKRGKKKKTPKGRAAKKEVLSLGRGSGGCGFPEKAGGRRNGAVVSGTGSRGVTAMKERKAECGIRKRKTAGLRKVMLSPAGDGKGNGWAYPVTMSGFAGLGTEGEK